MANVPEAWSQEALERDAALAKTYKNKVHNTATSLRKARADLGKLTTELVKVKAERDELKRQLAERRKKGGSTKEDEAANTIAFLCDVKEIGASADINDIASLEKCWVEYCNLCMKYGVGLQNMAAYMALGITQGIAEDWLSAKERADRPEFRQLIAEVNQMCGSFRAQQMSAGKMNAQTGIWWQKNFDGLTEAPRQVTEVNDADKNRSPEEIASKYGNLLSD